MHGTRVCDSLFLLSRFSLLSGSCPKDWPSAAQRMQNAAFRTIYPQHMVFLLLDPVQLGRYSSSNLCPIPPQPGRHLMERTAGGNWLVNLSHVSCRRTGRPWIALCRGNRNCRFLDSAARIASWSFGFARNDKVFGIRMRRGARCSN